MNAKTLMEDKAARMEALDIQTYLYVNPNVKRITFNASFGVRATLFIVRPPSKRFHMPWHAQGKHAPAMDPKKRENSSLKAPIRAEKTYRVFLAG